MSVATLPWWAAVPVAVLLVIGGLITLVGTLGLLRLKTFYQRIHGPAIAISLGAGCILVASMVYFTVTQSRLVIHELLIGAFLLMTAPVVSMLMTLSMSRMTTSGCPSCISSRFSSLFAAPKNRLPLNL